MSRQVTLVIPAYNEERRLPATLASVTAEMARLVDEAEVLVVDDGSSDATASIAEGFPSPIPLRVLRLARGEHLDLAFRIPPGAECNEIELRANGHYTPLR